MKEKGKLIFFCGKMGSGKTTVSKRISEELDAILISEDEWLSAIYPNEFRTFNDYVKYSPRLKSALKEHVKEILKKGTSVVMDFPGNTINQRSWFKDIFLVDQIPHELVFMDVEDSQCIENLKKRRQEYPARSKFDTEEVFREVSNYFESPSPMEGFNIKVIKRTS